MFDTDLQSTIWSCLLDGKPPIWNAFPVWVASLIACAGVRPEAIVVHHVAPLRDDVARLCDRLGLRTVAVEPFHSRSVHSNKIKQCKTDFGAARRIVLTDVDIAVLAFPPMVDVVLPVAGRVVDYPNPPVEILETCFACAGLSLPDERIATKFIDEMGRHRPFDTMPANFNGGLYVLDCNILKQLGETWAHWTQWLLKAGPQLGRFAIHVDQIGFCMAVRDLNLPSEALNSRWNLPTHIQTEPSDATPFVLHHHGRLDSELGLLPLQPPRHTKWIAQANLVISAFLAETS